MANWFSRKVLMSFNEKRRVCSISGAGTTGYPHTTGIKIKAKTIKCIEENIGVNFHERKFL